MTVVARPDGSSTTATGAGLLLEKIPETKRARDGAVEVLIGEATAEAAAC